VVEISPLGLVEMTRQNVTEGVREVLTRTCPTCGGEGVVLSEETMAVEAERRLRKLARAAGAEALLIRLNAKVASLLVGPGGAKLLELERDTGKFFSIEAGERLPLEEVDVVSEGPREEVLGGRPTVTESSELKVKIDEPHMYNTTDGVAHVDGYPIVVGGAITYVGQQHRVRIDRITRATAFASLLDAQPRGAELPPEPGGMELPELDREVGERLEIDQRSKPRTRRRTTAKKKEAAPAASDEQAAKADAKPKATPRKRATTSRRKTAAAEAGAETAVEPAVEEAAGEAAAEDAGAAKPRRRTRRGSRGRGKSPEAADATVSAAAEQPEAPAEEAPPRAPRRRSRPRKATAEEAPEAAPAVVAEPAPAAPEAGNGESADGRGRASGLLGKLLGS
jgi:ribonuclease G